jgi:hypothetical protein
MKTMGLIFLTVVWRALASETAYAAPPTMKMRPAPWSAVAAATAFDSFGKFGIRQGGSCCYRTPRWLRLSYFQDGAAAGPRVTTGDAEHGAPAGDGRQETGAKASDEQRNHGRASSPNHPPSRTSLTKVNRPMPIPKSRQPPMPGNALHPPGSNISAGAAKGGLIPSQTVNSASPIRTTSVVRPTGPVLNSARHRGPNPAVVGGSPNLRSSNAGTINGTRMNRKP